MARRVLKFEIDFNDTKLVLCAVYKSRKKSHLQKDTSQLYNI